MPGKTIQRWVIGHGGFLGEVTLFELSDHDRYVCHRLGRYVELSNLYVHPLRRGQGWARKLMEAALSYARRRGFHVFLRAVPYGVAPADLEELIAFYRSYGFRQVRRGDARELILWHDGCSS